MGLSVRWASCNLGAYKPDEYGDYYSWGEIEVKNKYTWGNYKFNLGSGSYGPFSKYNSEDNKKVLDLEDDVAHVKLGGNWRMPTEEECNELIDQCNCAWTNNYNGTGIRGCIITATNGNTLFLPCGGYRWDTSSPYSSTMGFYWSSSRYSSPGSAHYITIEYDDSRGVFNFACPYGEIFRGQLVRAVFE